MIILSYLLRNRRTNAQSFDHALASAGKNSHLEVTETLDRFGGVLTVTYRLVNERHSFVYDRSMAITGSGSGSGTTLREALAIVGNELTVIHETYPKIPITKNVRIKPRRLPNTRRDIPEICPF